MGREFVHYHNHSEYSALDGVAKVKDMVARAQELGHRAIGLTDHGNMSGLLALNAACKDTGVTPILGTEFYTTPWGHPRTERIAYGRDKTGRPDEQHRNNYHLIALAMDEEGFNNLCRLTTFAYADGFYYKPRIDFEVLQQHSKGLVVTSACLAGEVNHWLKVGNYAKAREIAAAYKDVFGENYYLETMYSDVPEQRLIIPEIARLGKELGIKVTQANDAHYVRAEDAEAQRYWLMLAQGKTVDSPDGMRMGPEYYLKDYDEMLAAVGDPVALANTMEIAEKCNVVFSGEGYKIPIYDIATDARHDAYREDWAGGRTPAAALSSGGPLGDEIDHRDFLHWMCMEGYERLVLPKIADDPEKQKQYMDRLDMELDVIDGKVSFVDYFLIVQDYVNYARDHGMPTGPGRGSAAGSLVSYLAGITRVDPIPFRLHFERFLNPDRIGMPDIDIDFPQSNRQEIMEYVRDRYTPERAAQVMTFGYERPKGSIKDMARVLGYPAQLADSITKTISEDLKATIQSELDIGGDFARMYNGDPDVRRIVDAARKVEGLVRGDSIHASAFVISPFPIADRMPMQTPKGQQGTLSAEDTASFIIQFDGKTVDKLGYLKMDFLGLGNLDSISNTQRLVKKVYGKDIDLEDIPFDDKKTLALLRRGETAGLFQFESEGMTKTLKQVQPTMFSEISDIIALYRPGPMEYIPDYIDGKKNPESIPYLDTRLKPILEETYGVAVYQEQLMEIAKSLAGFSMADADWLRKAIGKKLLDVMESLREKFADGCRNNPDGALSEDKIASLWALMEAAGNYSFNKSHSVAYAFVSWYTAYLKANYPAEFLCSMLSYRKDHSDRDKYFTSFFADCRRYGVAVLPPHVNRSGVDFDVAAPMEISFGLSALKGVGEGVSAGIMAEREANGEFKDLNDFLSRVDPKCANSGVIKVLAKSGALDGLGWTRKALVEEHERIVDFIKTMKKAKKYGDDQPTLDFFDELEVATIQPETSEELPGDELLDLEKEMLGFYLSGNPLEYYEVSRRLKGRGKAGIKNLSELDSLPEKTEVAVFASVARIHRHDTVKGPMAFVTLQDFGKGTESVRGFEAKTYTYDMVIFRDDYQSWGHGLREGDFLFVHARTNVKKDTGQKGLVATARAERLTKDTKLGLDGDESLETMAQDIREQMAREYAEWSNPDSASAKSVEITLDAERAGDFMEAVAHYAGDTQAVLVVDGRRKELGGIKYNKKMRLLLDFLEADVRVLDGA